jgi:hypothetical protein
LGKVWGEEMIIMADILVIFGAALVCFWLWMARIEPLHELEPTPRLSILEIKLSEDEATRIEYDNKEEE